MTTHDTPAPHDTTTTATRTMRAAVHARFGDPRDAIELAEVPVPTPADDEVLVAVEATGIAIGDWLTITGTPYVARPMYGIRTPKQRIAGLEMSGTVVAVGSAVTRFAVGDEVFGAAAGSLAEFVAVPQDAVVPRPSNITPIQAAAVPVSATAALQAVRDAGGTTAGQKVLVVGASGAVGTFAVQIAKALGAEVTGVASTRNLDMLRSIGADHVIDYTREGLTARGGDYDVILNIAGNNTVRDLRAALSPNGTLVMIGGSGGNWTMGFGRTLGAVARNPFVRQRLTSLLSKPDRESLETLAGMLAAGDIVPVIDRTDTLDRTVDALEHVGSRHTSGKSVVTI